jgi:hypothetical protein
MMRAISSNLGVTLTILWIMDSMVFWPHNRNDPPSRRDIMAVATGVVPE